MIKEKRIGHVSNEEIDKVEKVRNGFKMGSHVGLTKLGRSTHWREKLEAQGALELLDRNETAGVILEPKVFEAMLNYMDEIDEELEQERLAALFERRKNTIEFLSGEALATKALVNFKERQQHIRRFLDDNK